MKVRGTKEIKENEKEKEKRRRRCDKTKCVEEAKQSVTKCCLPSNIGNNSLFSSVSLLTFMQSLLY